MTTTEMIYRGVDSQRLLVLLLVAVSLVLLGWGIYQLVRRRWRYAAVCLAAALSPVVGVPLAAAALAIRAARLTGRAAALAWAVGGALAAAGAAYALSRVGAEGIGPGAWMLLLGVQIALAVGLFYAAVYAYLGTPAWRR
jgi:hypothetical protein